MAAATKTLMGINKAEKQVVYSINGSGSTTALSFEYTHEDHLTDSGEKIFNITSFRVSSDTTITTTEKATVTIDSKIGTAFDIEIFGEDVINKGVIIDLPAKGIQLAVGDKITLAYGNTDTNLIGFQVIGNEGLNC